MKMKVMMKFIFIRVKKYKTLMVLILAVTTVVTFQFLFQHVEKSRQFYRSSKVIFKEPTGKGGCRYNYSNPDVDTFVQQFQQKYLGTVYHSGEVESYQQFLAQINALRKQGKWLKEFIQNNNSWAWEIFHQKINQYFLYDPSDTSYFHQLLKDLNQRRIISTGINEYSSHLVLKVQFDNGAKGIFKFLRRPKEQETLPDHFFFSDIERPGAEIASFHLDKILGFYRVPPAVGRILNITEDIKEIGVPALTDTLHRSPVGNICFFGKCKDYCKVDFSICGTPDTVPGVMIAYLPHRGKTQSLHILASPWIRVYSPTAKAKWEKSDDYCESTVKKDPAYQGKILLDFTDVGVFDFLIGNLDRHHVEFFEHFDNDTFLIHFDNGRGFGKSKYDCLSCLAPVRQCCLIRLSTLAKLVKLYIGPDSLSHVLRESLSYDPLSPVLWEPHLDALDRRVGKIIKVISDCIKVKGKSWSEVVIDDGFN